jgi:Leucine-rich repeat (LRR) protein
MRKIDASHDKHGRHISVEDQEENRLKLIAIAVEKEAKEHARLQEEQFMSEPMEVLARTTVPKPQITVQVLKLNNNNLHDVTGCMEVFAQIVWNPQTLTMLDLSFNGITKFPKELLALENLKVLYMHANEISGLKEIEKCNGMRALKGLTFHGNPVDETTGYRQYAIACIPQLSTLDFTRITLNERAEAVQIVSRNGALKKSLNKMMAKLPGGGYA